MKILRKPPREEDVKRLEKELGISRLSARLLAARGISPSKALSEILDTTELADPRGLKNLEQTVSFFRKVKKSTKVGIMGDYDVDGITSTVLLKDFLQKTGYKVFKKLPDRKEGYGLTSKAADFFIAKGVKLVFTVDCGIGDLIGVKKLREAGIDVIILDHHLPRETLPDTPYIVNPHLRTDDRLEGLCGCGVVYYFIREHNRQMKKVSSLAIVDAALEDTYISLVALATVADMVPLLKDNRTIVKKGLKKSFEAPMGIGRLYKRIFPAAAELTPQHLGFYVAPMINACSRMASPTKGFKLLTTNDRAFERTFLEVKNLNQARKDEVRLLLKEIENNLSKEDPVLIVTLGTKTRAGILGIAASQLLHKYKKPALVLKKDGRSKILAGSGRSAPPINLYQLLKKAEEFIDHFGGHAVALGLQVKEEDFEDFKEAVFREYNRLPPPDRILSEAIDLEIGLQDLEPKKIRQLLRELSPFGSEFPEPTFKIRSVQIQKFQGSTEMTLVKKGQVLQVDLPFWHTFSGYSGVYDLYIKPIPGTSERVSVDLLGCTDSSLTEILETDILTEDSFEIER